MTSKTFIKMIALCIMAVASVAVARAQSSVSGTVTDDNGQPVIGATVLVKGTMHGTMTAYDGTWSLQVTDPETAVIQFSCIGYASVEEALGNRAVLNVVMAENMEQLDDVVVIGYGTQKKVNLTGSVAAVNFSEIAENRTITSTSAALAGLVPGMSVNQTTSQPGAETTTIRIRGTGSFSSSSASPLVLLDGVEWSLDYVNPNDIESISVLKDAASTAIYGTRAANGVILITSKNGNEAKPRISYSFKGIWQTPYNNLEWVTDYADYMELVNEADDNTGAAHTYDNYRIATWREKKSDPNGLDSNGIPNYISYPNTDWYDTIFNTGFSQEHSITISGGSKSIRYLISGSYLDNTGIMNFPEYGINSSVQKATFRTNVEADVTKWATIGTKIYGQYTERGYADVSAAFTYLTQVTSDIYPGEPGAWGVSNYTGEAEHNLLASMASTYGSRNAWRINGNVYAKIRPYKGLSIEGTFSYHPSMYHNHYYDVQTTYWNYNANVASSSSALENATVTDYSYDKSYISTDLLARYDVTIKKEHVLGVLVGYSASEYSTKSFQVTKQGATDWSLHEAETYSSIKGASYSVPSGYALRSYFARVNYSFKDRYLFEGNFRADGSSTFGSHNRWGFFPSFSAGWKIHEEPWMAQAAGWLNELKLRASWGQTGNNQGLGNYDWQATYSTGDLVMDGSTTTSMYIAKMSNPDLKWETTTSTDVGLDLGFFRNRLTATADYYYKYTKDIIYTTASYMSMGQFDMAPSNLGAMWNQGAELSINWKDTKGDFYYYAGVNFAYNKNHVTKYKGKIEIYEDGTDNFADVSSSYGNGYLVDGHEIGEHYIYKLYNGTGTGYTGGTVDVNAGPKDGMIRTEADMAWVKAMMDAGYTFQSSNVVGKNALWYGDFIYQDLNGDGNYGNSYDRYWDGKSNTPAVNLGVTFGFSWKGLDFSMIWSGQFGYEIFWCTSYYSTTRVQTGYNISKVIANDHYFYDPDNPTDSRTNIFGRYPRLYKNADLNVSPSSFYEYNGNYMKLKNITLGYTIPEKLTQKFFVKQLRVFVSGDNLLTITNNPGMDPEIGNSVTYPLMRQYTVGAQITF